MPPVVDSVSSLTPSASWVSPGDPYQSFDAYGEWLLSIAKDPEMTMEKIQETCATASIKPELEGKPMPERQLETFDIPARKVLWVDAVVDHYRAIG